METNRLVYKLTSRGSPASTSRALSVRENKGLSRINSKVSIATKKKTGRKVGGGGGADPKIVSELQLNVKKLLEDVRKLNLFEHDTKNYIQKADHKFEDQKVLNEAIIKEQAAIK